MIKNMVTETEVDIMKLEVGRVTVRILGKTPLIYNRMTEKAKRELLMPKGKKTVAEKAITIKHNPLEEYRNSAHSFMDDSHPTRFYAPASWFKNALMTAALDIPGVRKTEIGRLLWILEEKIPVFGISRLYMTSVVMAGISGAPDIRTRAILPEWACEVTCEYVRGKISDPSVVNLFAAAGLLSGVGDHRQQKGKGNYGQWFLVGADDAEWKKVSTKQDRISQDKALISPQMYDLDTQELYNWYEREFKTRYGKKELSDDK